MSGGSYDYLCHKSVEDLIYSKMTIEDMAMALDGLGYADDVATETAKLLLAIRQFADRIEAMQERLSPVWRAMEWWESGDTSEVDFKKALETYRGYKETGGRNEHI